MVYINKNTGSTIETDAKLGGVWELATAPKPVKKDVESKETSKPKKETKK